MAAAGSASDAPQPPLPVRETSATRRAASFYPAVEDSSEDAASECVVCLSAPRDTVLLECRHACVCEQCAGTLATCPLCRANIASTLRIFT